MYFLFFVSIHNIIVLIDKLMMKLCAAILFSAAITL